MQTFELDGKIEFTCQHDSVECFANKIHSCAIEYVKDSLLQLKYIACMITDNLIPDDAGDKVRYLKILPYYVITTIYQNIA